MKARFTCILAFTIACIAKCAAATDVVFLVDESGSVSPSEFSQERDFLVNFGNNVSFGPAYISAGIIEWAKTNRLVLPLTQFKSTFLHAAGSLTSNGGSTSNLVPVLTAATNHIESAGRSNATRAIVILSEGSLTDDHATLTAKIDALASRGYDIFPVGGFDTGDPFLATLARNAGRYFTIAQAVQLAAALSGVTNRASMSIYRAVEIGWTSQTNKNYQPQWATQLNSNQWFDFGPIVAGDGKTNYFFDTLRDSTNKFFRVIEVP
jgi:hypothetical protein